MNSRNKYFDKEMSEAATIFLVFVISIILIFTANFHIPNSGQHTGYVTSVEQSGIIWKTWTVYIKTDPQSSQEDAYCVIDPSIITELQNASTNRNLVTISYAVPFIVWKWQCGGEQSTIVSDSASSDITESNSVNFVPDTQTVSNQSSDDNSYQAYITQIGGIGSVEVQQTAYKGLYGNEGQLIPAQNYAWHSFNSTNDLMWANCKDGYQISAAESPTGNKILGNQTLYHTAGIEIENNPKNIVVITCQKI